MNLLYKKSQNHFIRLVSSSPFNIILSTKSGLNSTKSTKYTSFSGFGTLRNKILHRVLREKLLKLPVKLPRQRFIVGNYQCWPLQLLDDIGHGEGLAGPRNTQ